jgi:hypothetical protein
LDPKVPGVAEFGILHEHEGDCSVRDAPKGIWNHTVGKYDEIGKTTSRVGATIEIVFDRPVPYVGWYLKVNDPQLKRPPAPGPWSRDVSDCLTP